MSEPMVLPKLPHALRLVGLDEFVVCPDVSYHVRDIVPSESIVVVFGQPKSGKTFTVTDIAMHGAHGMNWHGHVVNRPLRVAFLAGEGRPGLKVRLYAWRSEHGAVLNGGDFKILPEALSLPDRVGEVLTVLREYKPDVVVTDTLNAYFGSGDENSTRDMTAFVNAVRYLRDELKCAIVIIHHTGLADASRERGSGVLRGAADVICQVARDQAGTGLVGFQVIDGRDIEAWPDALGLRLRSVTTDWKDAVGEPMKTCVVESADQPVTIPGRGPKLTDAQQLTVNTVNELAAAKANGSPEVLLSRIDVVTAAVGKGANRTASYRNITQLASRMKWELLEPGSLRVRLSRVAPVSHLSE